MLADGKSIKASVGILIEMHRSLRADETCVQITTVTLPLVRFVE